MAHSTWLNMGSGRGGVNPTSWRSSQEGEAPASVAPRALRLPPSTSARGEVPSVVPDQLAEHRPPIACLHRGRGDPSLSSRRGRRLLPSRLAWSDYLL